MVQCSVTYSFNNASDKPAGSSRRWNMLGAGVLAAWLLLLATHAYASESPWIMVDTTSQSLSVIQNGEIKQHFPNISLGRNGYGASRFRGDRKTPLGEFRVAWINTKSQFRTFFGLDYPNYDHAKNAVNNDIIDYDTYLEILAAIYKGRLPPQNTVLGGYIGIHGLGNADPNVHNRLNWTRGCVALTNEQIDALARWINVGTRVIIAEGALATLDSEQINATP